MTLTDLFEPNLLHSERWGDYLNGLIENCTETIKTKPSVLSL